VLAFHEKIIIIRTMNLLCVELFLCRLCKTEITHCRFIEGSFSYVHGATFSLRRYNINWYAFCCIADYKTYNIFQSIICRFQWSITFYSCCYARKRVFFFDQILMKICGNMASNFLQACLEKYKSYFGKNIPVELANICLEHSIFYYIKKD
jgi:hypothetical protein